jgi:hypothetical protein
MKLLGYDSLFRPIEPRKAVLVLAMALYVLFSLVLFFAVVSPSLSGETQNHITADSARYMYFADSLREGRNEPWVLAAMFSFPNTFWFPVLLALLINSTFLIVILNYAIFSCALWLFMRAIPIRIGSLLVLLLVNATTLISLLSVNKEILDLLATALFCYWLSKGRKAALVLSLIIALINRYEILVAMLLFMLLRNKWNPLRRHRLGSLICVCLVISILFPVISSTPMIANRLDEAASTAQRGGILITLDNLQLHYLFFIATIPKIADNLFSEIINVPRWSTYNMEDAANTYILFLNNLANLYVLLILMRMRRLNFKREWLYLAATTAIVMAISPVIQPRYFYSCYVLFCLEASRIREPGERFWQLTIRSQRQNRVLLHTNHTNMLF